MASPGQRVAAVSAPNMGLPAFQSTNEVTGGGLDRLNEAYHKGFLTTEDVINGLTIRKAKRNTGMAEEGKKQKDLAEDEQLRGLNFRAKKAKATEAATMGELGAETSEAYAGALRSRGGIGKLGENAAGNALVASETEVYKLDQSLREAHKLKDDPIGLTDYFIKKAAEFGEDVDPNASLPEARAKFQAGYHRRRIEAMEDETLKAKLKSASDRGTKVPELEQGLRKEFDGQEEVKVYNKVAPFLGAISDVVGKEAAGRTVSGADDLKLIFSYMKLLDPGSVVRETEFANAQNAGGIPDVIQNVWNRAREGTRLNSEMRKEFLESAQFALRNFKQGYDRQKERYNRIASGDGLRVANVTAEPSKYEPPETGFGVPDRIPADGFAPVSFTPEEELELRSALKNPAAAAAKGASTPAKGTTAAPKNPNLPPGVYSVKMKDGTTVKLRKGPNPDEWFQVQ